VAIYRAPRPDTQFTQIRNDVIRDQRLSYRARGVLVTVLSLPDDWQTSAEELTRRGVEGRDAIRAALTELEEAGYLRRVRRQDQRGRWSTQNVIYDTPSAPQASVQEVLFPGPDSTDDGFPGVGSPVVGNPGDKQTPPTNNPSLREGASDPEPPARKPADEVATALYEAMDKMGNYMALRSVAAKALKAGHPPEAVQAAMMGLLNAGKPLTGQTVYQALSGQGATIRDDHRDHWTNGGGFTAEEGPRP
jgi:hypothetical protein